MFMLPRVKLKLKFTTRGMIFPSQLLTVPLAPSFGVYIFQLVHYARLCSNVLDFSQRNLCIIEKKSQEYWYHKLVKMF